jgi:hypothetical protein
MIDTVAKPLCIVKKQLDDAQIKYKVSVTSPTRQVFDLDDFFYVIRQQLHDGVYHLVVAAKMGKEKLK